MNAVRIVEIMVLILYGNTELSAHVRGNPLLFIRFKCFDQIKDHNSNFVYLREDFVPVSYHLI